MDSRQEMLSYTLKDAIRFFQEPKHRLKTKVLQLDQVRPHGSFYFERISFFLDAWCLIQNIMQPENMLEYSSPDATSDLTNAFENRNGVSFPMSQTPTVRAFFNAPVSISTVALQPVYKTRASNIIKFSVYYVTQDNKPYIDPATGKVLTFTTEDRDTSLTIQHDLINNLKGLNVTILQTSGGRPTWFRLKVLGCYKPSMFCKKSSY